MITINDNDNPIEVAAKIITGTKKGEVVTGGIMNYRKEEDDVDMFDVGEIKEIADYLKTYYKNHIDMEDEE